MKASLMYRDRDFDLQQEFPLQQEALMRDLEVSTLLDSMAHGDKVFSSSEESDSLQFKRSRHYPLPSRCSPGLPE